VLDPLLPLLFDPLVPLLFEPLVPSLFEPLVPLLLDCPLLSMRRFFWDDVPAPEL